MGFVWEDFLSLVEKRWWVLSLFLGLLVSFLWAQFCWILPQHPGSLIWLNCLYLCYIKQKMSDQIFVWVPCCFWVLVSLRQNSGASQEGVYSFVMTLNNPTKHPRLSTVKVQVFKCSDELLFVSRVLARLVYLGDLLKSLRVSSRREGSLEKSKLKYKTIAYLYIYIVPCGKREENMRWKDGRNVVKECCTATWGEHKEDIW